MSLLVDLEELAGVGVGGLLEDLAGGALLDDLPGIHDREAVGRLGDHAQIVGAFAARDAAPDRVIVGEEVRTSEGLDLIEQVRAVDAELPLVVMTAWSSVEVAVQAIQNGARDFIEKPWDNSNLLIVLRNALERRFLVKTLQEKIAEIDKAQGKLSGLQNDILRTFI